MKMTRLKYENIRTRSLIIIIGFGLLGIYMTISSFKSIEDVESVSGTIETCGILKQNLKLKNDKYTFYFKLENYDQMFGVFLGSGDNAIKEGREYQKVIKKGDRAEVHFDNNLITEQENITRLLLRLEINGRVLFAHRPFTNWAGIGLMMVSLIFSGLLVWAKIKREQFKKYGTHNTSYSA
jgi:hypothetical protein